MTFPITPPVTGATTISTTWGSTSSFANSDQNNTNNVANYAWGGVEQAPTNARVATGTESLTIASGSVTTIAGTTVDGVSVAANDVVLIPNAPSSTGAAGGTTLSTQPGNGLYVVTAVSTNISVSRASTMSTNALTQNANLPQGGPAGRVVFVRAGGTLWANTMFQVVTPSSDSAFTYGSGNIAFKAYTPVPYTTNGTPQIAWSQLTGATTTTATVAVGSAAQTQLISYQIPVAAAAVGSTYGVNLFAVNGGTGQATITWQIHCGTTNTTADQVVASAVNATGASLGTSFNGLLTVRSTGASGTCMAAGQASGASTATNTSLMGISTNTATQTINTTSTNPLYVTVSAQAGTTTGLTLQMGWASPGGL
jgi:hypothetical protein